MLYIPQSRKRLVDPKIDAFLGYCFGSDPASTVVTKENGVYFWYFFLTSLYQNLYVVPARDIFNEWRNLHFMMIHGSFEFAAKELFERWSEADAKFKRVPALELRAPGNIEHCEAGAKNFLENVEHKKLDVLLSDLIITDQDDLGVAYHMSPLESQLGFIDYTITEVANALVNLDKASPQEMLDVFIATNHALYRDYVTPFNRKMSARNLDTKGFISYWEKQQKRSKR